VNDLELMALALAEARRALEHGDVPIGAVAVVGDEVVAAAHNERELLADPTAHAEILALRAAARHLGRWRLTDVTLYVTVEPCPAPWVQIPPPPLTVLKTSTQAPGADDGRRYFTARRSVNLGFAGSALAAGPTRLPRTLPASHSDPHRGGAEAPSEIRTRVC